MGAENFVNDWVKVVRRARLDPHTKLVALLLASYADPDGTNVYPGVARLAVNADLGYRTVQRILARLRANGWIAPEPRRGVRRHWSTPYRLTLPPELLDREDIPSPAAEDAAVDRLRTKYRGRHRPKSARHSSGAQTARLHAKSAPTARHSCGTPPSMETPPSTNPPSDDRDLRTEVAVVGDPQPVDNPESDAGDDRDPAAGQASPAGTTNPQEDDHMRPRTPPPPRDPAPYGVCPACSAALDPDGTCFVRDCPGPTAATVDDDSWPAGTTRHRPSRPDPTAHPDEPLAAPSPADLTTRPHRGAVPHTDLEQLRDTINARRTP